MTPERSAAPARAVGCNNGNYQAWWKMTRGLPAYRNAQTSKCLDLGNTYGVRGVNCDKSNYQHWEAMHV
ncbi:hypothetical protein ABGB18_19675 [Nonomuraea sp. B12E4]|uniref:hypothetical protein n=1 Tax=Nonomuraea sp. B12E4 TaxID=3153564 RepID=UPI00325F3F6D